jgi:hypothetical protein
MRAFDGFLPSLRPLVPGVVETCGSAMVDLAWDVLRLRCIKANLLRVRAARLCARTAASPKTPFASRGLVRA